MPLFKEWKPWGENTSYIFISLLTQNKIKNENKKRIWYGIFKGGFIAFRRQWNSKKNNTRKQTFSKRFFKLLMHNLIFLTKAFKMKLLFFIYLKAFVHRQSKIYVTIMLQFFFINPTNSLTHSRTSRMNFPLICFFCWFGAFLFDYSDFFLPFDFHFSPTYIHLPSFSFLLNSALLKKYIYFLC